MYLDVDVARLLLRTTAIDTHTMRSLLAVMIAFSARPDSLRSLSIYDLEATDPLILSSLIRLFRLGEFALWGDIGEIGFRSLLRDAISLKGSLGTPEAILGALDLVGLIGSLSEWWQLDPPGDPYTAILSLWSDENDGGGPDLSDPTVLTSLSRFIRSATPASRSIELSVGVQYGRDDIIYLAGDLSAYSLVEIK